MKMMQERRDVQTMIQSNVSKNFLRSISPLSIPTCDCQAHPTWSKIKQVLLKKKWSTVWSQAQSRICAWGHSRSFEMVRDNFVKHNFCLPHLWIDNVLTKYNALFTCQLPCSLFMFTLPNESMSLFHKLWTGVVNSNGVNRSDIKLGERKLKLRK